MTTIKAIVRGGRLETSEPIDLPDGTELTIPIPDERPPLGIRDDDWADTPEAIEAWIAGTIHLSRSTSRRRSARHWPNRAARIANSK